MTLSHRLKVLLLAYACQPDEGSEPGVGWQLARALAAHHDMWVLTRRENRQALEARLQAAPVEGLQVAYCDLPGAPDRWQPDRPKAGVELHYYLWQHAAARAARRLHARVGFDVAQHLTYVRYWMPSGLAGLAVPFVWGPVGGGESTPAAFLQALPAPARRGEQLREAARWLGEHDPLVRRTARRCAAAVAVTPETAARLRALGARRVEHLDVCGLPQAEIDALGRTPPPPEETVRFVSVGRLLAWKGFDLGLRAFAEAALPEAEYWVVGDGPERARLEALAQALGVAGRVRFWGRLPRPAALELLGQAHVLVHPSLHDSGGWVCTEALAARRPVVCLDLGGPALQVPGGAGLRVAAHTPAQAVADLRSALTALAADPARRRRMGEAGHDHVRRHAPWAAKAARLAALYAEVLGHHHAPAALALTAP